jgi:8-oxo-dGTP pyrophosphatase MutT (NUDIX family)
MNGSTKLLDAAVLAPIYRDAAGALRMIFILRTERGIHGGQIAFPGGRREAEDVSYADAALREAEEEIGLDPASVRVLAELPVITTSSTGFRIHPFLGVIRPAVWRPQPEEVSEVLDVAVADLAREDLRGRATERFRGSDRPVEFEYLQLGPHRLWGATWRIVSALVPRLESGEWPIDG